MSEKELHKEPLPIKFNVRRIIHQYLENAPLFDMKKMAEEEALRGVWTHLLGPMMLDGKFSHSKKVTIYKDWMIDYAKTYSEKGHPIVWVLTLSITIEELPRGH